MVIEHNTNNDSGFDFMENILPVILAAVLSFGFSLYLACKQNKNQKKTPR